MATPIQVLQGATVERENRQKSKDPRFPQRSGQSSKTVPQLRPCGCGPIGRAVASESHDPWFKTQHHNILIQDKDQIAGLLPLMVLGSSLATRLTPTLNKLKSSTVRKKAVMSFRASISASEIFFSFSYLSFFIIFY